MPESMSDVLQLWCGEKLHDLSPKGKALWLAVFAIVWKARNVIFRMLVWIHLNYLIPCWLCFSL